MKKSYDLLCQFQLMDECVLIFLMFLSFVELEVGLYLIRLLILLGLLFVFGRGVQVMWMLWVECYILRVECVMVQVWVSYFREGEFRMCLVLRVLFVYFEGGLQQKFERLSFGFVFLMLERVGLEFLLGIFKVFFDGFIELLVGGCCMVLFLFIVVNERL